MWLTERAQVVEEMTGQLHTAVRLLRLAQEFHPEDTLTRQLSTVASLQDGLQGGRPNLTLHACCASLLHCQPVSVSCDPASVLHCFLLHPRAVSMAGNNSKQACVTLCGPCSAVYAAVYAACMRQQN